MLMEEVESPTEPDLKLLHRFTETGDPGAFAEIVERYSRVVYSASIRVLNDEARAQDVSQETFYRLMQRPKLVTHSLAGWLHRTATHLALDVRRSEKSRRIREFTYGLEHHQENRSGRATWAEVSPYVDQVLNEIKEPARGLLIRHFLQGVPQSELAGEMKVSAATLSRRIKSGLEELQQGLRKRGIHLGVATLMVYCSTHTKAAVPATLLPGIGKLNLVASMRNLPGPHWPIPVPPALTSTAGAFMPAKFAWTLASLLGLFAIGAAATANSWMNTRPFVHGPPVEECRLATK